MTSFLTNAGVEGLWTPMRMNGNPSFYSLYLHIPFCTRKCPYCHFYVIPDNALQKQQLTKSLVQEWELLKNQTQGKELLSLYFGGGTPSLLSPEQIHTLLSHFPLSSTTEVTLEANPEVLTLAKLKSFREAGINRLSIGVQTFSDTLLKKINRTHQAREAQDAIEWAFQAGFKNITIDLIYDLPHQTLSDWKESLQRATSLPITHLSLYNLVIEPHTSFYKHKKEITSQQPPDKVSTQMYTYALSHFHKQGWEQYELSAFCKEGYRSIHNTGYWLGRPFLGLGPSAHSYWNGQRSRNWARIQRYTKCLANEQLPIEERETLSLEARLRELFCVEIRMLDGIKQEKLTTHYPFLSKEISTLIEEEFLEIGSGTLTLTHKGMLFYDTVASTCI